MSDRALQRGVVVEPAHQNIRGHWQCTLQTSVAGDAVVVITVMN